MSLNWKSEINRFVFAVCTVMCVAEADAQPLDDVTLEYQSDGIVATIHLNAPVQYLRHFPEKSGKTLEIFYDRAQGPGNVSLPDSKQPVVQPEKQPVVQPEKWVDNEVRNSPPSGLIPSFTVTTRDQQTKPKLVIEFEREAEFSVAPGKDNQSLRITIKPDKRAVSNAALPLLPIIKAESVAAPAAALSAEAANLAENNKQARVLMVQGREALAAGKNEAAIGTFNQLLLLPPNDFTQDGQEWVGVSRERAGQIDKAKTEYDLYLRLYAEGEGVARVMQRLTALSRQGKVQVTSAPTEEKKNVTAEGKNKSGRWINYGGVSSHYYFSRSNSNSTQIVNFAPLTTTQTLTDTSMLITNVDVSGRYASDEYDGRLVFSDADTTNFIANQPSRNRVNAAYGEIKNRKLDYLLRVGRQSSSGAGVMGRFDGVYGSYANSPLSHINAVAGALADFSQGSKPTFFGASYDKGAYTLYAVNQSVDGMQDRRGVGAEWRYFEGKKTLFATADYDTYFRALNVAQFMGTLGVSDVNLNFMLDHRKAPYLSARNALIGANTSSVITLSQSPTVGSLKDLVMARTATSNMAQLGATWSLLQKWQVGGDVRLSNTSGLPQSGHTLDANGLPITQCTGSPTAEGCIDAQAGRGLEKTVSAQIVGSGLYKEGDIWSANASVTTSSAVNGQTLYLYNQIQLSSNWSVNTALSLWRQTDQAGGVTSGVMPQVRGYYRIKDQLTFEAEGGISSSNYEGTASSTKTKIFSCSAGLRWDF